MSIRSLTTVLLGIFLIGCTKKEDYSINRGTAYYPPYQSESDSKNFGKLMANSSASCAEADCPENIGLIVFKEGSAAGQCTGSLVGRDVVLTNSHCIPESIKKYGASCGDNLGFVLPNSRGSAKCSEVIYFSDISSSKDKPDYAFFRIDKALTEKPLRIMQTGASDNEPLHAYVMDPASEYSIKGLLRKKNCVAVQNSIGAADFTENISSLIAISNCEVIDGNSGSPLMNSNGDVIGVVSHSSDVRKFTDLLKEFGIKAPSAGLKPGGKAASLSCVDIPRLSLAPHAECQKVKDQNILNQVGDMALAAYEELFETTAKQLPQELLFKFSSTLKGDNQSVDIVVTPVCFKAAAKKKYELVINDFTSTLFLAADSQLRLGVEVDILDSTSFQHAINVNHKSGAAKALKIDPLTKLEIKNNLHPCSKEELERPYLIN